MVSFCPHSFQHLLFVDFFSMAILTGVRLYHFVVLVCIFLIISDVEYLFIVEGEGCGNINWEFGIDVYTLLYLKYRTNKDLLYMTRNSTQYSVIS